jgi:Reverse transcriptase (RNA-dependent DNA polymerase)
MTHPRPWMQAKYLSAGVYPLIPVGIQAQANRWMEQFGNCTETQIATYGIQLEMLPEAPTRYHQHPLTLSKEDHDEASKQIKELLMKGYITRSKNPKWVSSPFIVNQANGKKRLCFDMSRLGTALPHRHFKMEGLMEARALSTPTTWYCRLDLKDAYHSVPILEKSRPLLAFRWNQEYFQWKRLPFGLSLAPFFFTKLVKKALSKLRAQGHMFVQYLDDILIPGNSPEQALISLTAIIETLVDLGFQINLQKSQLQPKQTVDFLGFTFDARQNMLKIPAEKLRKCKRETAKLILSGKTSPRRLASTLGLLNSVASAVRPGLIQQRWSQRCLTQALTSTPWDSQMEISPQCRKEMIWWRDSIQQFNGNPIPITLPRPSWVIETDASETGWGIVTPTHTYRGFFPPEISNQSSNFREMWTATKAVLLACKLRPESTLQLRTDNTTVVSLINKQGTTVSEPLLKLAKQAWNSMLITKTVVQATYIQGEMNLAADTASRAPKHDYSLCAKAMKRVRDHAPGRLSLDMFASASSAQIPRFWTREQNALSKIWPRTGGYAFPPPRLLPAIIQRARLLRIRWLSLLTPAWRTLPSLPTLIQCSLKPPIWIPPSEIQREKNSPHFLHPTTTGVWCWVISGLR